MKGLLKGIQEEYDRLSSELSGGKAVNPRRMKEVGIELKRLGEIIELKKSYDGFLKTIKEAEELVAQPDDPEMEELAREELETGRQGIIQIEGEIKRLLIPVDKRDEKGTILEIRAGTGGDEAALFAMELFRMYEKISERKRWKLEVLHSNLTGMGGLKEIIASISGKNVYRFLKYESGTHRVQRVPKTETGGRLHTSAATVAVLPEVDEVELEINETKDLKIDVFRSSGPGGQSVNTTDSAVRITHLPTGLVVTCQDEKSQHKNRARALKVLRSRLMEKKIEDQQKERSDMRKTQVGSGDRSEKIRTYNFPQSRVTDHRIKMDLFNLNEVLDGNIDEFVSALSVYETEKKLEALMENQNS